MLKQLSLLGVIIAGYSTLAEKVKLNVEDDDLVVVEDDGEEKVDKEYLNIEKKGSLYFKENETKMNHDGTRKQSNFRTDASQVPTCPEDCTASTCEWCWNDTHLRNGLVYHLNSTFYDKYVYSPALNRPSSVPKKSEMEFDTNPQANWLIGFTRDRFNTAADYNNEMLYKSLWGAKRELHEDINCAWVDVNTPEGELMKHTFDVHTFPHIILVTPAGYYEMPWVKSGWTASDVSVFADLDYTNHPRNPLRDGVSATTLFIEYVIDEIAKKHFEVVMDHIRMGNKMAEEYTGSKWNFKAGYEHFGKKNKYRKQQIRYLIQTFGPIALGLLFVVIFTIFMILSCLCKCICGKKQYEQKEKTD